MNHDLLDLLFSLTRNMSVFMILAYLLTRMPFFGDGVTRNFSPKNRIILILFFGAFSIYGTSSGIFILGGVSNFRDLGPAIAGLLVGPLVGVASGVIGGIYRYSLGGLTVLPCALAPVMAGLLGGIFFLLKKGRTIRVVEATVLMMVTEVLHGALSIAILGPLPELLDLLRAVLAPMILANGAGMAVFIFMINNLARERRTEGIQHRMDSELHIAHEIQMSMIPTVPPAPPVHPGYLLSAAMKPAKEVGGDLYNFFPLDDERLCLAIGDVADKGVPASLYMATTQKLIKALARGDEGPADLLARLNDELCDGNETMTFVTLFLAFFDRGTGEIRFANGGHLPPYRLRPEGVSRIIMPPGIALGISEAVRFTEQTLRLDPGETLFLYTDGVTEAMNEERRFYTDDRLEQTLSRLRTLAPDDLCRNILNDLSAFAGRSEQSDDITMIAIRYTGPPGS